MMRLKPSEIMFSQDSVNNFFVKSSRHGGVLIGETLDDICEGRCSINDIPTIRVMERDGKWVTADNRRLWVFRELERLGKCDEILVRETYFIAPEKLKSTNGGVSIRVRRHPGGRWHNKPNAQRPESRNATPSTIRPNYTNHGRGNIYREMQAENDTRILQNPLTGTRSSQTHGNDAIYPSFERNMQNSKVIGRKIYRINNSYDNNMYAAKERETGCCTIL